MSRDQNLRALKSRKQFDLLVIGGGITGLGIALEAQSRGLQTCLVEAGDFAQESSGKSSKMVHGGLRYLEQAFSKYDYQNFKNNWQQMKISIIERNYIMQQSQSAKQVPILIPTETFGQAVWIYMGSLLFQFIHNFYQWKCCNVRIPWKYPSLITQSQIKQTLPSINNSFQYAVVTYDAQNDDSEHCIDLAQKTTQMGGVALNYCKLDSFKVDQNGAIQEAVLQDVLSQYQHKVQAKVFINCTGAFADKLRMKAEPKCQSRLKTAQGSHISLDQNSILKQNAIVNFTKFSKGFINFMIYTWQNQIIVGTTASMAPLTSSPVPKQAEVEKIISELKRVTNLNSQDIKVKGGWAGIQPILMPGKDVEITKDHKLEVLPISKLISVFTTRYSTYHFLAQKTVDYIVSNYEFNQRLDHHQKDFSNHQGFQEEKNNLKQDILNSINTKFAVRACDYIMRRGERIGLKDRKQTHDMVNQVVEVMSEHFKWNQERKNFEYLSVICEVGL